MLIATHVLECRAWVTRLQVVWGLLLCGWGAGAWGETVQSVPRPARNTWVVDVTRTLSAATLAEVNQLGSQVDASGLGQLAVAVVSTTEGRSPRSFATELFNRWGVGDARRNDGALLFIALKDRKAELILGDGVDTPEDVARSQALMRESIIPAFRRGDANGAVRAGARGLQELLLHAPLNQRVAEPVRKPAPKEAPPPVRERKEFLDDEGMYVELSGSSASEAEAAASSKPGAGVEARPSSSEPLSRREAAPGPAPQGTVAPWSWAAVGGFFVLLLLMNALRRRREPDGRRRSGRGSFGGGRSSGGGASGSW